MCTYLKAAPLPLALGRCAGWQSGWLHAFGPS